MNSWKRALREQSYSRRFIWKTAIAILMVGLAMGALVEFAFKFNSRTSSHELAMELMNPEFQYFDDSLRRSQRVPESLIDYLRAPGLAVEDVIAIAPYITPYFNGVNQTRISGALAQQFGNETATLLGDSFIASSNPKGSSRERLELKASMEPPPRYANRLLGELEMDARRYSRAHPYFRREGAFPEAERSRTLAVETLRRDERFDELNQLLDEPKYQVFRTPNIQLDLATHQRDWWLVAKTLPIHMLSNIDWRMATIAGIAALVWAALLLRLGQVDSWLSQTSGLCGLAFIAGALSVGPTLFLVILQDAYVGYQPDGDLVSTIAFFVGGVGLREESCKLLLFLPFAFYLARKGNELDALIIASFVGLGFAAIENIGYFAQSSALAAPARFLTANFFHIALTGMGGLYLCRAIRNSNYNDFLYVFGIMIVVHGLYNTLLSLPQFQEGSFFAMIVFILLSMYYFRELNGLNARSRPAHSLSFLFVSGLCLILASLIVFQSSQIGLFTALKLIIPEVLGSVLIVFMFFREFNEALGE